MSNSLIKRTSCHTNATLAMTEEFLHQAKHYTLLIIIHVVTCNTLTPQRSAAIGTQLQASTNNHTILEIQKFFK